MDACTDHTDDAETDEQQLRKCDGAPVADDTNELRESAPLDDDIDEEREGAPSRCWHS